MIISHITELIGNTPLLRIDPAIHGLDNVVLYAKLEHTNPFGSVKDRIAWGMIKDDLGSMRENGQTVIETSSGNTAKALSVLASVHGLKFRSVSALIKVPEVKDILRMTGADVEELPGSSDCFDPNDPNDPQFYVEKTAKREGKAVYFPSQFTNPKNPATHYETTGAEIARDLGKVDVVIGTLGTSGSTQGLTKRLRQDNPALVSIGVCAADNDFIPGIRTQSELWEVGVFDKKIYNDIRSVTSLQAVDGMQTLIRKAGVLAGPTSGGCYVAALEALAELAKTSKEPLVAVFIVCDRAEWYVSYLKERCPEMFGEAARPGALALYREQEQDDAYELDVGQIDSSDRDAMIVDIRTAQSFDLLRIPGSVNMPVDVFRSWIDGRNPFDGRRKIILVCAVGEKSRYYAAYLRTMGCDAYNLSGGMMAWRDRQKAKAA